MTREEIQAELDALKETKFDRNTDAELLNFEKTKCNNCGKLIASGSLISHKKNCERLQLRDQQILEFYNLGYDSNRIGNCMGISGRTVGYVLTELNLKPHGTSLLQKQIDEIIDFATKNPKISATELSRKFGIHHANIATVLQTNEIRKNIREVKKEKEELILKTYNNNPLTSFDEYKEITGYAYQKIRKFFKNNNLIMPNSSEDQALKKQETCKKILDLYLNQKLSNNKIATELNTTKKIVSDCLKANNLDSRETERLEKIKTDIRKAWLDNPNQSTLFYVEVTGYSKSTIRQHLQGLKS